MYENKQFTHIIHLADIHIPFVPDKQYNIE
jgi:hypothetical protein